MQRRVITFGLLIGLLSVSACMAAPVGWVSFQDPHGAFSVSVPADYRRDDPMQPGSVHAFQFLVPDRFVRGTNLSPDSRFSIEVITSANSCTPDLFQDNASGFYVETLGSITFNVSKTGDAGAGNFHEDDVFAVAGSQPCIAVRYFIHSHNIGNYDPGAVRAYDARGLIREFDAIRRTLVIRR